MNLLEKPNQAKLDWSIETKVSIGGSQKLCHFCDTFFIFKKELKRMNKERIKEVLQRLDMLADNLEKEALYYRKSIKEIKEELRAEGLI